MGSDFSESGVTVVGSIPRAPPNAKCVAGVWLPETEEHFVKLLTAPCKRWKRPIIDGKATIGYRWINAAVWLSKGRRVAVDIGANVGLWSMWLVREFAQVHAFEPVPDLAAILPWNMPSQNYTLHQYALGEDSGYVVMTVDAAASAYSHVGIDGAASSGHTVIPPVPMRTLDSFGLHSVDLLKIDVEGYERRVLLGAEQTIRSCRPMIVIEQNGHEDRYGDVRDSALALLKDWGARPIHRMKGDYFMGWDSRPGGR